MPFEHLLDDIVHPAVQQLGCSGCQLEHSAQVSTLKEAPGVTNLHTPQLEQSAQVVRADLCLTKGLLDG